VVVREVDVTRRSECVTDDVGDASGIRVGRDVELNDDHHLGRAGVGVGERVGEEEVVRHRNHGVVWGQKLRRPYPYVGDLAVVVAELHLVADGIGALEGYHESADYVREQVLDPEREYGTEDGGESEYLVRTQPENRTEYVVNGDPVDDKPRYRHEHLERNPSFYGALGE
jgi:hypothetical protein